MLKRIIYYYNEYEGVISSYRGKTQTGKAISKLMRHAKELVTVDVYGDKRNIIPEEIPELLSYMDDVMPKKEKEQGLRECVLEAGIKIEGYLPGKGKPE